MEINYSSMPEMNCFGKICPRSSPWRSPVSHTFLPLSYYVPLPATVDCFTVSLHSPNCLPLRLCKETVSGLWKFLLVMWTPIHCNWGNPMKGWYQPIGGHVSYPTDSPTSTSLGLFSSLPLLADRSQATQSTHLWPIPKTGRKPNQACSAIPEYSFLGATAFAMEVKFMIR